MPKIRKPDLSLAKLELIDAIIRCHTISVTAGPVDIGKPITFSATFLLDPATTPIVAKTIRRTRLAG